jgi:hypothetical protein
LALAAVMADATATQRLRRSHIRIDTNFIAAVIGLKRVQKQSKTGGKEPLLPVAARETNST